MKTLILSFVFSVGLNAFASDPNPNPMPINYTKIYQCDCGSGVKATLKYVDNQTTGEYISQVIFTTPDGKQVTKPAYFRETLAKASYYFEAGSYHCHSDEPYSYVAVNKMSLLLKKKATFGCINKDKKFRPVAEFTCQQE